jgi:hypothetical protein
MTKRYADSYDPLRRRRVRAAARELIPEKAWSNDKVTGNEIARLALLRVLFLQHEVRRAARNHENEATAMLARASVEAAITGLYCVLVANAADQFDGETGRRAKGLLKGLATDFGEDGVFDGAFNHLGSGRVPQLPGMVKQIIANGGPPKLSSLYDNFYTPLSSLYLHGGPIGLLRHVRPKSQKTRATSFPVWSRRSATQTADAMVGLLAAAIAPIEKPSHALFREYETAHWGVTWTPMFFIARGLAVSRIQRQHIPAMITLVRQLRAKVAAGQQLSGEDADEVILRLNLLVGLDRDDPSFAEAARLIRSRLLNPSRPTSGEPVDDSPRSQS